MAAIKLSTVKKFPILAAFIAVWGAEATMNALYGYRSGATSSTAAGLLYGTILLSFAFLGAWLGVKFLSIRGYTPLAWGRRLFIGIPLLACIVLSQITGWSVMGITISDSSAARENKADSREAKRSALKRAQEDRNLLGAQPAPAEVQAKIDKELQTYVRKEDKTVGTITSNCARPDWAPTVCRRVADLKIQLQSAERAIELDRQIASGSSAVETSGAVGAANARTATLEKLTGWSSSELDFWLNVFFVGMVGLFANLGPTLAGFADPQIATAIGGTEAANPAAVSPPEQHHHYYQPQVSMPPYPPPVPAHYPPPVYVPPSPSPQPLNISLQLGDQRTGVVPLRARDALAEQPEPAPLAEPDIPMPRFLSPVSNPRYPLYAKVFHALEIKPETYINLSTPCKALALTAAHAFRRYTRTIPSLDAEISAVEQSTYIKLTDALNMLIADIREPDEHVSMLEIQKEMIANYQVILLLPGGPHERALLGAVERLEQREHDSRSLQYIRQLRHAVVSNPRATDTDWRQLYQVLQ